MISKPCVLFLNAVVGEEFIRPDLPNLLLYEVQPVAPEDMSRQLRELSRQQKFHDVVASARRIVSAARFENQSITQRVDIAVTTLPNQSQSGCRFCTIDRSVDDLLLLWCQLHLLVLSKKGRCPSTGDLSEPRPVLGWGSPRLRSFLRGESRRIRISPKQCRPLNRHHCDRRTTHRRGCFCRGFRCSLCKVCRCIRNP
jgi:hypothetical protein